MPDKVLIIEDEQRMRRVLQLVLESQGYQVETAGDGNEGILKIDSFFPDLIFTDLKMPKADGMEVLKHVNLKYPDLPVILLTAFGTIPTAVEAMKHGALDYITKPVDNDIIIEKVKGALKNKPQPQSIKNPKNKHTLIGASDGMKSLNKELELVASTNTSVIIFGESGTGKELAARTIQKLSSRSAESFVRLNCAAIPKELMESELFGHKKGAFTGAVQDRKGAFIKADKGTLFLDEIGDMPIELQAKLLHAVEDKLIIPLGSTDPIQVDVKIISATNQDIKKQISDNKFRLDLYFRLNTYSVHVPSLGERKTDIPELVQFFLNHFGEEFNQPVVQIQEEVLDLFKIYSWPGNVRELKNIIERLVLISKGEPITPEMVRQFITFDEKIEQNQAGINDLYTHEKTMIKDALIQCGWNISKASRQLGITRNTLRYRIKKYQLKP